MHAAAIAREEEAERLAEERAKLEVERLLRKNIETLRGDQTLTPMSGYGLIKRRIEELEAIVVDPKLYGELYQEAIDTRLAAVMRLTTLLGSAEAYEAEQRRQATEAERIRQQSEELAAAQRAEQDRKDREEQERRDQEAREAREREEQAAAAASERAAQERRDFVPTLDAVVLVLSTTYGQTTERVMEWLPGLVKGKARKAA